MIPRIAVKKIMGQRLETIDHQGNLKAVAQPMASQDVGRLLVTKDGGVVGIMTETDVVRRVLASEMDLTSARVEEIMSYPVYSIDEEESLDQAHELMGEHHVRHLRVTCSGKPAG